MPRARRRVPNYEFVLYDSDTTLGWRVNGRISAQDGERLEAAGHAVKVYEEISGKHVGWQKIAKPETSEHLKCGDPTPQLMNVWEIELVAGVHGKSQTMGMHMNDPRRLTRVRYGKMQPPEDDVERAVAKLVALTPRHLQAAS